MRPAGSIRFSSYRSLCFHIWWALSDWVTIPNRKMTASLHCPGVLKQTENTTNMQAIFSPLAPGGLSAFVHMLADPAVTMLVSSPAFPSRRSITHEQSRMRPSALTYRGFCLHLLHVSLVY